METNQTTTPAGHTPHRPMPDIFRDSGLSSLNGGRRRDLNASALPDAIPGTASATRGTGFRLASGMEDAFKGFKRGVCPRRDFDQSVRSFVSARQSRGGSVRRRGGCCDVLMVVFQ
ncbi:hypothetical protein Taro_036614 [Colocasia esculenta]|uniref:Uncharacterized protein n=1 Tax=Colocasia esculenta TaxID=4460 RepID=A0A843WGU1_COLES|nr:hypothetical protein [Colocasia esculenta]